MGLYGAKKYTILMVLWPTTQDGVYFTTVQLALNISNSFISWPVAGHLISW
jgi:hypothetical protein